MARKVKEIPSRKTIEATEKAKNETGWLLENCTVRLGTAIQKAPVFAAFDAKSGLSNAVSLDTIVNY